MVKLCSILFGCASLIAANPITVPLGSLSTSLSRRENDKMYERRTIGLRHEPENIPSCQGDQGRKHGSETGPKGSGKSSIPAARAIYFITNAAQNSVVALKVEANGTVSDGSITATGGVGMVGLTTSGTPAEADGLSSQGAIKVAGKHLIAVNPGSNTITMFKIDSADPTKLTMVGQPVDTLGEFPNTVTISTTLKQACVANTGAKAGVACFYMCSAGLIPLDTTLRPFEINQTTPPVGPLNTVSQVLFNADSTALLTTVKGDPTANKTGFLSVFPVINGSVSTKETRSSPAGTAVLFGAAALPHNALFVTDASFGSATLSLSSANIAAVSASTKIPDQVATCWVAISNVTKSAFVTDVAVNHLVEIDTVTGELIKETNLTNGNPGMIDLVSAGTFLYALSPGNATVKTAVTVFDVSGGRGSAREVQNFFPRGVSSSVQGMAFV